MELSNLIKIGQTRDDCRQCYIRWLQEMCVSSEERGEEDMWSTKLSAARVDPNVIMSWWIGAMMPRPLEQGSGVQRNMIGSDFGSSLSSPTDTLEVPHD